MARTRAEWVQVELKVLAGAERWLLVRYRGGCFKLPVDAQVGQVLTGVARGWQLTPRGVPRSSGTIRVSIETYVGLVDGATGSRTSDPAPPQLPVAQQRDNKPRRQPAARSGRRRSRGL